MKLYYFALSPYSQKALIALAEKGAQYQLVPSDPDQARQARFYDRLFDLYVAEPALEILLDGRRPADKRDAMGVEAAEKRLDGSYALFDEAMAKKTWVLGDTFSMGDVSAAAALAMARRMRPFAAYKNLVAYLGRLSERKSVQRTFALAQEHMARR